MSQNDPSTDKNNKMTKVNLITALSKNRNYLIIFGILLVIAGSAAILFPLISSISIIIIIGVALVISGIVQIIQAFGYEKWSGLLLALFSSIIWLVAGGVLLARPMESVAVFTIFLAIIFIAEGMLKLILALQMRALKNWTWVLFDAVIALFLGFFLWIQFPFSALWSIGVLSGLNILSSGIATLAIALTIDSMTEK